MSDSKFTWHTDVGEEEWQWLVDNSPQGTLFAEQTYLELAGCPSDRYLIRQGNHVKAGICVVRSADDRSCELDDLVIHNGILFLRDAAKKPVRQKFEQFELTEYAIVQLEARYARIELALAPQFEDMRPFLWHGYHDPDTARRFILDLRYTSYVDVSDLAVVMAIESSAAFRALETLRQRHIRDAAKKGGQVRRGRDGERLIDYYRMLMARQGAVPPEGKLRRMRRLVDGLVERARAHVYEVLNAAGTVVYVTAYAWDGKRAYYLFGAGHPDVSEPWQGTLAHWGAFVDLARAQGIREIDLEGVNSPQRGWFKLGFGGELLPYYQVYGGVRDRGDVHVR